MLSSAAACERLMRSFFRVVLVLVVLVAAYWLGREQSDSSPAPSRSTAENRDLQLREAFRAERSDVWLEVEGVVSHMLDDDLQGSRHQRFILETRSGLTLLVSHNIDLAPRVPLQTGDGIDLRGEYEWNAKGGILHWTHDDPQGRRPGGWIRHGGSTYR